MWPVTSPLLASLCFPPLQTAIQWAHLHIPAEHQGAAECWHPQGRPGAKDVHHWWWSSKSSALPGATDTCMSSSRTLAACTLCCGSWCPALPVSCSQLPGLALNWVLKQRSISHATCTSGMRGERKCSNCQKQQWSYCMVLSSDEKSNEAKMPWACREPARLSRDYCWGPSRPYVHPWL